MELSVYLADLRHNFSGVLSIDGMPLGVAYLKAVMDRDLPGVRSRLFVYPDRLLAALESEPPDVLMLSNYMWNEWLSFHFAAVAKRHRPETLVVMGGPNIQSEPERQLAYVAAHPEVDLYILGEADFLAREVVRHFVDAGTSLRQLGEREIPSSIYRRPDGTLVRTAPWERRAPLDEIPSPWLTGCLDEFFDGRLAPLIETNRGCPFQCTFCVQGVHWYTKVHSFGTQRLREEINYIGARIQSVCPEIGTLVIADSNYGMFERDIETSTAIGEAQRQYGWPTYIQASTGKNRPERIIESIERVNGALVAYHAVQSLDDETLRNVKRSNISKDAYDQVMIHVRGRGLRSLSDLILGLPGETLHSHLASLNKVLDSGTDETRNLQAMLLKGSELETLESRRRYHFESRFRVLPKNFGIYGGEKVFDVDEIVVATDTMSFDDYLEARKYHLACSIFWNNSWFEDAVSLVLRVGVARSEWVAAMRRAMEDDRAAVGELVADFVRETTLELFPTRQACVDFYSRDENFARLQSGASGDNLMYKYRALASFFLWPEVCHVALKATHSLLIERSAAHMIRDFDTAWADLGRFIRLKHAHGTAREALLAPVSDTFLYDIPRWIAAGMPPDPSPFRLPDRQEFIFELAPQAARELKAALRVWTPTLKGLTKGVTRIRTAAQVRTCRPTASAFAGTRNAAA